MRSATRRLTWTPTVIGAVLLVAACQPHPAASPSPPPPPPLPPLHLPATAMGEAGALHALQRLTFGPRPGDLATVRAIGVDRWIADQLRPATIAESPVLQADLAALPTQRLSESTLYLRFDALRDDKSDRAKDERAAYVRNIIVEARTARLDRAILSERQLQEVLVGFWYNHFNVYADKGDDRVWVGAYENNAIRPYVFGPFRTLLEATARHPAMLYYLDNWQNTAPGSLGAHGEQNGLNENYARELMELHTLGVDGGYRQQDVTELARILTGWGLRTRRERPRGRSGPETPADFTFVFDPSRHDFGDKTFLGTVIHGQGPAEIEQALDILCRSPATAHHLSFQLAQYFVADTPDPALVNAMAATYLQTGGNLTAVLRTLFESPAFWAESVRRQKYKTPFEYVVSALRAAAIVPQTIQPLLGTLNQLGQTIYGYETPDGYKQTEAAWLSPDGMARRLSFATVLGGNRMKLMGEQNAVVREADLRKAIGPVLSPATIQAVAAADPPLRPVVLLGSPDFMVR